MGSERLWGRLLSCRPWGPQKGADPTQEPRPAATLTLHTDMQSVFTAFAGRALAAVGRRGFRRRRVRVAGRAGSRAAEARLKGRWCLPVPRAAAFLALCAAPLPPAPGSPPPSSSKPGHGPCGSCSRADLTLLSPGSQRTCRMGEWADPVGPAVRCLAGRVSGYIMCHTRACLSPPEAGGFRVGQGSFSGAGG